MFFSTVQLSPRVSNNGLQYGLYCFNNGYLVAAFLFNTFRLTIPTYGVCYSWHSEHLSLTQKQRWFCQYPRRIIKRTPSRFRPPMCCWGSSSSKPGGQKLGETLMSNPHKYIFHKYTVVCVYCIFHKCTVVCSVTTLYVL